jgi:hypothetical protein
MLAIGSIVHTTALAIPYFRDQTSLDLPEVVDLQIATLDEAFGFQISSAMSSALDHLPSLRIAAFSAYALVQIPIVVIAAICWRRRETRGMSVIPAFMIASMIGFVCYHLAPAIGPKVYFGETNPVWHAPAAFLSRLPLTDFDPHHPRNSMPSLHFTWAVLVYLFSRGLPFSARVTAGTFTFLTFCATLGLREHYFVDLVVAMPLVLLVRGLCAVESGLARPEKYRGVALGAGMLVLWIGLIPAAPSLPPALVVALSILTTALSITFEADLAAAELRSRRRAPDPSNRADIAASGVPSISSAG